MSERQLMEDTNPTWARTVPLGEEGERRAAHWFQSMGCGVSPDPYTEPWPKGGAGGFNKPYDLFIRTSRGKKYTVEVTHDARALGRGNVCLQCYEGGKENKLLGTADLWVHVIGRGGEMRLYRRHELFLAVHRAYHFGEDCWFDPDMGTHGAAGYRMNLLPAFNEIKALERTTRLIEDFEDQR